MGIALSLQQRKQIVALREAGHSFASISRSLTISYSGVRKIWARYQAHGQSGLRPSYDRCGPPPIKYPALLHRSVLYLRHLHPTWGSPIIHQILVHRFSEIYPIPSSRTVHRWLKNAGLIHRNRRSVSSPPRRAGEAHEVWQIDGKEKVKIKTGERICWLSVGDEKSRSILGLKAFPPERTQSGGD